MLSAKLELSDEGNIIYKIFFFIFYLRIIEFGEICECKYILDTHLPASTNIFCLLKM